MNFLERSLLVSPGGAQTRSKRHDRLPDNFPTCAYSGMGSHVITEKGTYTDWICALGAVSLGYGYGYTTGWDPIHQQVEHGASFSIPHVLEVETAELLLSLLKWEGAEQVRWLKTGSEGTAAAMQLARAYTRRNTILSIGYHGWHEAHLPPQVIDIPWGDMWDEEDGREEPAAVLLEACRDHVPPEGYLEAVREYCDMTGALLISDECVTGFRWAIGGACEYFGFTPDLAVYGKGMANGYPLAALVGSRSVMRFADAVSGTFSGEAVSLAAAKATLEVYAERDVIGHMWRVGKILTDSGKFTGYPCHPRVKGEREEVWGACWKAAERWHLIHPAGFNVSYSHTEAQARELVDAIAT